MLLYSYIFYSVYRSYNKFGSSTPYVYAVGIVSLLQLFTVFDVIAIFNLYGYNVRKLSTTIVFIIAGIAILINHLYYYVYKTPDKIEAHLNTLTVSKKKYLKILTWIHVVITVGLFIVLLNLT